MKPEEPILILNRNYLDQWECPLDQRVWGKLDLFLDHLRYHKEISIKGIEVEFRESGKDGKFRP